MQRLLRKLSALRASHVSGEVAARMAGFRAKGRAGEEELFKELCFCLLTANYSSEGGMRVQEAIGDGFLTLREKELARELRRLGYRFPNARARYIVEARAHRVRDLLEPGRSSRDIRERLAGTVLGLGFKESSHFLRNIGYDDLAIIDFHIVDVLSGHGLINRPKSRSLSRSRYLEIEKVLGEISRRSGLSQGELDLYLWYMGTGKILK